MLVPKCALSQFANWDPTLRTGIYLSQFGNWDPRHNLSLQTGIEYMYMCATQDVIEEIASA